MDAGQEGGEVALTGDVHHRGAVIAPGSDGHLVE